MSSITTQTEVTDEKTKDYFLNYFIIAVIAIIIITIIIKYNDI